MSKRNRLAAIILAAGKGTRMQSPLAKVLHPILGKPMLVYPIACAKVAGSQEVVVVVGHQAETIKEDMKDAKVTFIDQREQLGTGHAVMMAREHFQGFRGTILILCGDVPLLKIQTIEALLKGHRSERAALTVLTTLLEDPSGYGRIVKGGENKILKIVEEKDASVEEKKIKEINTGIYCVESDFLFEAVAGIENRNAQREYYLTDIVGIAVSEGKSARSFIAADSLEVMGINTQEDLEKAEGIMKKRKSS